MAVKFGMTVLEIIGQLTNGFRKVMGRDPDGLEKIKIQQEAVQRFKDMNKVVDMEGNVIDTSKGIMGGRQIQENKEFGKALREYLMRTDNPYSDLVKETKKGPKTLEQRRKEAEEALKNKNVKPIRESLEDFVDDAGGVNPDDPRGIDDFIPDPDKKADGGRAGFANGSEGIMSLDEGAPSILLRPRASGIQTEQTVAPGINLSERDINYGITGILQGDKFYGGASLDKGKVKLDVETEDGQTLFKDTIAKDDALNFILGMGDPKGEKDKFQIKFDDDLENMSLILKKSFAEGGRANFEKGGMSRRQFMKIMGGIASLPFIGKYIKPAMPLIQKGAELTGPALDKIVQTVMSAGKLISQSGRRVKEMVTKKKLKDVEVEEDIMDGPSYTIKTKDKTIYYRPGRQDEMGIEDDIIEVIEDTVTKKAGGGIARMLGE